DPSSIDLQTIIQGVDQVLALVEQGLDGQVFGIKLPLVGSGLHDAASFIHDIRTGIIQKLETLGATAAKGAVQDALFQELRPGGLDIVGDTDGNHTIDKNDIEIVGPDSDGAELKILISDTVHLASIPLDASLGLPALGFTIDPGTKLDVSMPVQ